MARVRPIVLRGGALVHSAAGDDIALTEDAARHVRDVLRLKALAPVRVTDGHGRSAEGTIAVVDRKRVVVTLSTVHEQTPPPEPSVVLIQGIGKGDKFETVVRQTTELGVSTIRPVLTERTVATRSREDRVAGIVDDAMRVSGRVWRPVIDSPRPLSDVLASTRPGAAFVLELGAEQTLVAGLRALTTPAVIELLVGPEGGLSEAELQAAHRAGFKAAHLGPHTLRTETAGAAVVTLAMALSEAWAPG